jgi:hypothetical protein
MSTIETIKKTALPAQHLVILTIKRVGVYSLRPYLTFAQDDNGVASSVADFVTSVAALHAHDSLLKKLRNGHG